MSGHRWQHLDRRKPAPAPASAPAALPQRALEPEAAPRAGSPRGALASVHLAVRKAFGYYQLDQLHPCIELLGAALEADPDLPEAHRILGLALGRVGDPAGAAAALAQAVARSPEDAALQASLLSAQIGAGAAPEPPTLSGDGPLAELRGAAQWLLGQRLLGEERPHEAADRFTDSLDTFLRASPRSAVAERVAAAYVGQSISLLAAGDLAAAQAAFSRLGSRPPVTGATQAFAAQVYHLAEAARELPAGERAAALRPLAALVLDARLHLRFYDQVRPVAMHWEGLP